MDREEFEQIGQKRREADAAVEYHINVCTSSGCVASGSAAAKESLEAEVKARDLKHKCRVNGVGCLGLCGSGPILSIQPEDALYQKVKPQDSAEIVDHLGQGPVERIELKQDNAFFQYHQAFIQLRCKKAHGYTPMYKYTTCSTYTHT